MKGAVVVFYKYFAAQINIYPIWQQLLNTYNQIKIHAAVIRAPAWTKGCKTYTFLPTEDVEHKQIREAGSLSEKVVGNETDAFAVWPDF